MLRLQQNDQSAGFFSRAGFNKIKCSEVKFTFLRAVYEVQGKRRVNLSRSGPPQDEGHSQVNLTITASL